MWFVSADHDWGVARVRRPRLARDGSPETDRRAGSNRVDTKNGLTPRGRPFWSGVDGKLGTHTLAGPV